VTVTVGDADTYPAAPQPWAGSTRAHRLPGDWQSRRARVRRRAGDECQHHDPTGMRCPAPGNECDHINRGDDHSVGNLQWLCAAHHRAKTATEAGHARRTPEPHPGLL